jgi:hypothetical protein
MGRKIELERSLADDGVEFEKIAHWKRFSRKPPDENISTLKRR